jgi:hypothetical protein
MTTCIKYQLLIGGRAIWSFIKITETSYDQNQTLGKTKIKL